MFRPRLPTLPTKPFRGYLCKWSSFWEHYNDAVYTNRALPTTDKFLYLPNYLVGDVAAAIVGLPKMEAYYDRAIQLLRDSFGDKGRIIQRRFRTLCYLRHLTSLSDTEEVRRLYDCAQLNVRCLNGLNFSTRTFLAMLYDILNEALPEEIVVAFHQHVRLREKIFYMASSSPGKENSTRH